MDANTMQNKVNEITTKIRTLDWLSNYYLKESEKPELQTDPVKCLEIANQLAKLYFQLEDVKKEIKTLIP